ncbi:universal stress protein [Sphingomicrobium astaxanthinifaciens]|uniref:universal stress protein n=1 Tax=Sphingomicrobium astaxanthinifaciens TaxID=1227949 RepID=UPI001FCBA059|nr:universal stress protein [Sphingomicrobium astaxanthinifaciens]MCJ7420531.1 universal stress protein [Sphingomicrobium astaxanthinifaciens]
MYERAIVAVDVYDEAGTTQTLRKAKHLAEAFGTALHIVFVRPKLPARYMMLVPDDFQAIRQDEALQKLIEAGEVAELNITDSDFTSPQGSVSDEILNAVEELKGDLIILGAQQSNFARLFIGSNSNSIMRHSTVDVLLVRFTASND